MSARKSICMIVQNHYDIDPRVRRKADALRERGYEVDVIALQPDSRKESEYELDGVTIHTIPLGKKRGSSLRYIYEYLAFFVVAGLKVSALMMKKKYQIIDVNTLPDFLVFAALVPKAMGARVVLDMHEVMPEFYMSKYGVDYDHWIIRLIRLQEKLSMRFADHVLTINHPINDILIGRGLPETKSTIVMNSVNEKIFQGTEKPEKVARDFKFTFMYHGTLTPLYGLDIAVEAFAQASPRMQGAGFWIIGDGPERGALEARVRELGMTDKIKFLGKIPQQEVPGWIAQCDAGVLATRQDRFLDLSFSNKLPEYIVMGKPVIASRLKSTRHYFSENALSFFQPHNVEDLSATMVAICNDPTRRLDLVANARSEYHELNWEVMKSRYLDLLQSLAKDGSRRGSFAFPATTRPGAAVE